MKLQYFGQLMQRVDSLEKTLMLGGIGGRRRRGWQDEMAGWHHRLNGYVCVNSGNRSWTGRPGVLRFMGSQRVRHDWATELNWTELNHTDLKDSALVSFLFSIVSLFSIFWFLLWFFSVSFDYFAFNLYFFP